MASTEDKDKKTKDSDKSKESGVEKNVDSEEELSEIEVLEKFILGMLLDLYYHLEYFQILLLEILNRNI